MAVSFLYGPREHHGVASAAAYRSRHAAAMARKARAGDRHRVHEVTTPVPAIVSANSWVIECECGAGNATDPTWGFACCFGCGAVHTAVEFPADVVDIEAALLERDTPFERSWSPGERAADIRQQTASLREAKQARAERERAARAEGERAGKGKR